MGTVISLPARSPARLVRVITPPTAPIGSPLYARGDRVNTTFGAGVITGYRPEGAIWRYGVRLDTLGIEWMDQGEVLGTAPYGPLAAPLDLATGTRAATAPTPDRWWIGTSLYAGAILAAVWCLYVALAHMGVV